MDDRVMGAGERMLSRAQTEAAPSVMEDAAAELLSACYAWLRRRIPMLRNCRPKPNSSTMPPISPSCVEFTPVLASGGGLVPPPGAVEPQSGEARKWTANVSLCALTNVHPSTPGEVNT